jgi:hypothetical protein
VSCWNTLLLELMLLLPLLLLLLLLVSCVITVGCPCSFPSEEEKILALWDHLDAFKEQLRRTGEGLPPV